MLRLLFLLAAVTCSGAVIYVDVSGNDATGSRGNPTLPFLTVRASIAAGGITAGDMVQVGAGMFDEAVSPALPVLFPDGVSLRCAGANLTTLQNQRLSSGSPGFLAFSPGSNSTISHCRIISGVGYTQYFNFPLGFHPSYQSTLPTNVTVIDSVIEGGSDAFYARESSTANNQVRWTFIDCVLRSDWDAATITRSNATLPWDIQVNFINSHVSAEWNGLNGTGWHPVGTNAPGSVMNFFGGTISASGATAPSGLFTAGIWINGYGTVNLHGTAVHSTSSGGGEYSIYNNAGTVTANGYSAYGHGKSSGVVTTDGTDLQVQ